MQSFANHNAGSLRFGPDGFLYAGVGDGGSSSVKARSGQTTTAANFQFDLNISGAINSSDISAVKARSGQVLP